MSLRSQRDALQQQLTIQAHQHTKDLLELESALLKKSSETRETHSREMDNLQARVNGLNASNATLTAQLAEIKETTARERKSLEEKLASIDKENDTRQKRIADQYQDDLRKKDQEIHDLKATVRKLDDEIDARDAEHNGKMKDLQVAINSLMASRSTDRRRQ